MKRHKCMRCLEEFDCHAPDICKAQFEVLPNQVLHPYGTITEHCPQAPDWDWIRAYGVRVEAVGRERAIADIERRAEAVSDGSDYLQGFKGGMLAAALGLRTLRARMEEQKS